MKTQQHQRDDQYFGWMNQIHGLSKQLAGCQGEFFVIQEHKEKGRMIKAAGISKHIIDYTLDRIKEAPVSLGFVENRIPARRSVLYLPSSPTAFCVRWDADPPRTKMRRALRRWSRRRTSTCTSPTCSSPASTGA